jgi:hypothetical protein
MASEIGLARLAHRAKPVDPDLFQPDSALALLGGRGLDGRSVAQIASKAAKLMAMRIMPQRAAPPPVERGSGGQSGPAQCWT